MGRRAKGYWQDFANVRHEILAYVAEHGTAGAMPTITELRHDGHSNLVAAIHKYHGSFHQVAGRLHLSMARKPRGYWKDLSNVKRELLEFVADQGARGTMPTVGELRRAGYANLVSAIHEYHGDFHQVARQLNLSLSHKPKGYWKDFANVKRELLAFIAEHGVDGMMPTESQLRDAGHSSLTFAIWEYHGDFQEVARQLNLSTRRSSRNSFRKVNHSKHELSERVGPSGVLPTPAQLQAPDVHDFPNRSFCTPESAQGSPLAASERMTQPG
jgi:hypothetical protein